MPAKRAATKVVQQVQQLKLPSYNGRAQPPTFVSWLRYVVNINSPHTTGLTEDNIKRSWVNTLDSLHLRNRESEMDTKAAKEEIQSVVGRSDRIKTAHSTANSKSRRRMTATKVPISSDLDVNQYATIPLGMIHLQKLRYENLVTRLRRLNPGRRLNADIVEALLLKAVQTRLAAGRIRGPTASTIIDEARKVTAQGFAYWNDLADAKIADDRDVDDDVGVESEHKS